MVDECEENNGFLDQDCHAIENLPREIQCRIFAHLSRKDIARMSLVSKSWENMSCHAWECYLEKLLTCGVDPPTLNVISLRSSSSESSRRHAISRCVQLPGTQGKSRYAFEMCRQLLKHHVCIRCNALFQDLTNAPTSCCFHHGPMLGGGLQNGVALRWVCCNRRVHPSSPHMDALVGDRCRLDGCSFSYHVSTASAWEAAGNVNVTPRYSISDDALKHDFKSRSSAARISFSPFTNVRIPMEWDPHHRCGILELPSRLLSTLGYGL